jgi:hypothetical protein
MNEAEESFKLFLRDKLVNYDDPLKLSNYAPWLLNYGDFTEDIDNLLSELYDKKISWDSLLKLLKYMTVFNFKFENLNNPSPVVIEMVRMLLFHISILLLESLPESDTTKQIASYFQHFINQ